MNKSATPKQETLGPQSLYGGKGVGEWVRESGPDGRIVAHIRRQDGGPVDRMLAAKTIDAPLAQAGEQFHRDFVVAQCAGRYATLDLTRGVAGRRPGDVDDAIVRARHRVAGALRFLGHGTRHGLTAEVAWFAIGEQHPLDEIVKRLRWNGKRVNEQRVAGLLIAALERLALFYGLETRETIQGVAWKEGQVAGFRDGLRTAAQRADGLARACQKRRDRNGARALRQLAGELRDRAGTEEGKAS